ncbi:hypothetical protein SDRG_05023 [Saprolegnia diclina VS20]|uniref:Uncharacterized protein n=1 Tax=Saprolegnia diclina (strain VS20) TaxID=1156394 RepID=T0QHJ3_SAPDV|nr:hypothetical protein SDRG_05023 [Saprolegnia diclina VS20]EQC37419.1 hypothetical protein SDRG_05023 [Saprolegnia diclina VS20]|eukprot:XP_008608939.1 hypothetical protein SDRG_05023 [Saprolegnia diclina VS20]
MPSRRKLHCCFHTCTNVPQAGSSKCTFHRYRDRCHVENCTNQVYARQLCVRHGGKRRCQHPACSTNVRSGRFCSKHNPHIDKQCTEPGCTRQAHARQRCIRHGGGRLCGMVHCDAYARREGMCIRHHRLATTTPVATPETLLAPPSDDLDFIDELVNSPVFDHLVKYSVGMLRA